MPIGILPPPAVHVDANSASEEPRHDDSNHEATRHDDDTGTNTSSSFTRQVQDFVHRAYLNDALTAISSRTTWQAISDYTETGSRILAGVATILAFASSTYRNDQMSFAAGCVGTVGVTLNVFSVYSAGEARERLARLNTVLRDVKLEQVSDTPPMTD
jgi:hypothetical protein